MFALIKSNFVFQIYIIYNNVLVYLRPRAFCCESRGWEKEKLLWITKDSFAKRYKDVYFINELHTRIAFKYIGIMILWVELSVYFSDKNAYWYSDWYSEINPSSKRQQRATLETKYYEKSNLKGMKEWIQAKFLL